MHSMHSMHILGGGPAALSYMCLKDTSKKRIAMILLSLLFGNTLMIFSVIFKVFSKRKFNIVLGCSLIVFVTTHQLSPNGCRIEKCQVYFLVCSIRQFSSTPSILPISYELQRCPCTVRITILTRPGILSPPFFYMTCFQWAPFKL